MNTTPMIKNAFTQLDYLLNIVKISPDIQIISVDETLEFDSSFTGTEDFWETRIVLENMEAVHGKLLAGFYLYHRPLNTALYVADNPDTTARYLVEGFLGEYR